MHEDNYISGVQAAMQLWQLFRKLLVFLRNGDTRIAKDCRHDTYYYAKTTSKVCKYSERHKTTMLANSFHRMVKLALCIVLNLCSCSYA